MKNFHRLGRLFQREFSEAEMAGEMRTHLELQVDRHRAAGMNDENARHAGS